MMLFLLTVAMCGLLGIEIWRAVRDGLSRFWFRRAKARLPELLRLAGRIVVDRATGRVGRCCCANYNRARVWLPFRPRVGISFPGGEHCFVDFGAVRVALECERSEYARLSELTSEGGEAE
jgi:hypothetical protein